MRPIMTCSALDRAHGAARSPALPMAGIDAVLAAAFQNGMDGDERP